MDTCPPSSSAFSVFFSEMGFLLDFAHENPPSQLRVLLGFAHQIYLPQLGFLLEFAQNFLSQTVTSSLNFTPKRVVGEEIERAIRDRERRMNLLRTGPCVRRNRSERKTVLGQ
ncbi:hypothetical protein AAMO2058_001100500 [Amorphochlora amoebiformis]|mmetsp:Transcript_32046/g.51596  ORF Transcript_32046/g.51596 Transcript_32046/m.51596 type:complete len:113 (+) Transcript_32046:386-724(+)